MTLRAKRGCDSIIGPSSATGAPEPVVGAKALAWARQLPDGPEKDTVFGDLCAQWAQADPAAALAYELLLLRLFAIIQWHHFAYMIISVAMLGFGVFSVCLCIWKRSFKERMTAWMNWSTTSVTMMTRLERSLVSELIRETMRPEENWS